MPLHPCRLRAIAALVALAVAMPAYSAVTPRVKVTSRHTPVTRRVAGAARGSAPSPVARPGMVVGVDPETGRLGMPTRAQTATLLGLPGLALNHSSDGLVPQRMPDGSIVLDLQGRFQEYYLVEVDAAGRVTPHCLGDPAAIRRALAEPRHAPALEER